MSKLMAVQLKDLLPGDEIMNVGVVLGVDVQTNGVKLASSEAPCYSSFIHIDPSRELLIKRWKVQTDRR